MEKCCSSNTKMETIKFLCLDTWMRKDLNRPREFFTKLGFKFNPQFTEETKPCNTC